MYSPTLRLLTVLELLQSYPQMSGAEIARRLEVDLRTVRRYIAQLQDMGIPVEADRGPHGAYRLERGYKLPPLMFTDAEAVALTLGLLAIRELQFPVAVAAVEGALAKTERVMPAALLQQARGLQEAIAFHVSPAPVLHRHETIAELSLAVQQRRRVHLRYQAWQGQESARDFDAYGIVYNDGYWYAAGYCHLRQGLRIFRMDRILDLEAREDMFERPADFDVLSYVLDSLAMMPGEEQVEVLLKTTLEAAQAAMSAIPGRLEPVEDGVIFRRSTAQLEWTAHVLLTLDFPAVVLHPVALRDLVQQLAARGMQIAQAPIGQSGA